MNRREIPTGWRILELGARADYFDYWNDIRRQAPVHDAGEGLFLVTEWDLVHGGLRDPALRAGSGVAAALGLDSPVEAVVRSWLMTLNGEEHRRARGLVSRVFAPRSIAALEPRVRAIARGLARAFADAAGRTPVDFVGAVATRLPSEVARDLFAVDRVEWAARVEPLFFGDGVSHQEAFAAVQGLTGYFHELAARSCGHPTGGILDLLRAEDRDGDGLAEAEIIANAVLIVTAAIDTTAGLIANTLLRLLEHPAALARVRHDAGLIPSAIEEALRHCPSAPSSTRRAAATVEIGGVAIPAGSDLFFSFSAANRDPKKFAEPDEFDIDRDPSPMLTFGGGAHFCLGAALARMEARIAFEELFAAIAPYIVQSEQVRWRINNPVVRLPERLMISVDPNR